MDCKVIYESPVYYYGGCCPEFGQEISIYADVLKEAEIGTEWSCEDQDRYPNRTKEWMVCVRKVFEADNPPGFVV